MNLSTDKWSPNVRDLTVTVRPLPESLLQFKSVVIKVDGGKDMTCSEIRDIVLAGGIEADYLSRVPSCRKTGSLLVTATACTSVGTHGQTGNHVKFGVDIGYLSLDVPFWDKVAATCASEADPSHMTVYVGVPLNRLEGGMDGCASDNQDKQNQNCGEKTPHDDSGLGGEMSSDLTKLLNESNDENDLTGENGPPQNSASSGTSDSVTSKTTAGVEQTASTSSGTSAGLKQSKSARLVPTTWVSLPAQACKYCAQVLTEGTNRCDCITKHKCMAVQFNGNLEEKKIHHAVRQMLFDGKVQGWNLEDCEVNVRQGEKLVYVLNKRDCEFPDMTVAYGETMWLCVVVVVNSLQDKSYWCRHPSVKATDQSTRIKKRPRKAKASSLPKPLELERKDPIRMGDIGDVSDNMFLCKSETEHQAKDLVKGQLNLQYGGGQQSSDLYPPDSILATIEHAVSKTITNVGAPLSSLLESVQETVQSAKDWVANPFTSMTEYIGYGDLEERVRATSKTREEGLLKRLAKDWPVT
jgi:hypothetical protein